MSSKESLDTSRLESFFESIEPVGGVESIRTIIGEIDEDKWTRIRRVSALVLSQETITAEVQSEEPAHRKYLVDLAFLDRDPKIFVVCSAVWDVSPQAAAEPEGAAENKAEEQMAFFNVLYPNPPDYPPFITPEDVFKWLDHHADKSSPDAKVKVKISPNIYTVEGMEELIGIGNFRGIMTDGEA